MKRFIITALFAILLGTLLGIYSYTKFNEDDLMPASNSMENVYAFQAGVFDNFDNANTLAQKYGGIVIYDETKYRVYIAIVKKSLNTIKEYFDNLNISYYIKTIEVPSYFSEIIENYEKELTNNDYRVIIKNILKEYEERLL